MIYFIVFFILFYYLYILFLFLPPSRHALMKTESGGALQIAKIAYYSSKISTVVLLLTVLLFIFNINSNKRSIKIVHILIWESILKDKDVE